MTPGDTPSTAHERLVDQPAAKVLRGLIAADRMRRQHFPANLFGDPSWRILLALALARCEGRTIWLTALAVTEGTPPSSGRRSIEQLEARGLLTREKNGPDRRIVTVTLSARGWNAILAWLASSAEAVTAAAAADLVKAYRHLQETSALIEAADRQMDIEQFLAAAAPGAGRRPEAIPHPVPDAPAALTASVSAHEGRPSRRPAEWPGGARGQQPETAHA